MNARLMFLALILIVSACGQAQQAPTSIPKVVPPVQSPTSTPITHTMIPVDLPAETSSHASDYDSSQTAGDRQASGGDRFTFGEYERPFNANSMDVYFPYLDILDMTTFQDETWIYASILLRGTDSHNTLPGNYALEIDPDLDGKGDWLVIASKPASTDWTTEHVQVWQDSNKDVGGNKGSFTDDHASPGNGYETLVFGSGQESDPDMAWVRIAPGNPSTVQFAIKRSIVGNDNSYMAGVWAGSAVLNPAQFDFNDHMTHEQAGASLRGFEVYYPIKGLAELDSSCRTVVGAQPTGNEPGLCKTLTTTNNGTGADGCPITPAACAAQGMILNINACECVYP